MYIKRGVTSINIVILILLVLIIAIHADEDVSDIKLKVDLSNADTGVQPNDDGLRPFIIKFKGPLGDNQKKFLEKEGVVFEEYIPDYSYKVNIYRFQRNDLKKLDFVEEIIEYRAEFKVAPELLDSDEKGIVNIILSEKASKDDVIDAVADLDGTVKEISEKEIKALIDESDIKEIAKLNDVKYIEKEEQYILTNDEASLIIHINQTAWPHGIDGSGIVVGVSDSGLDTGIDNQSVYGDIHFDFDNRVTFYNWYGSSPDDVNGHGTHVSGSVLGNGNRSTGQFKGMAYNARLVFQGLGDDAGSNSVYPPSDLNQLFQQAYNDNATVHTNSWGGSSNTYNSDSSEIDEFMWNHPDMLILFAAGNRGLSGNSTIGVPATCKNCITVGSSENNRPDKGTSADNINEVASTSSRGPANDGRIKPDVVAPGTYILSTLSSKSGNDPCGRGNYNSYYAFCSGTSMATPIAAGASAMVRQYLNTKAGNSSAALVKAAIINGAQDMGYGIPHNASGWGRMNLTNIIAPSALIDFVDNKTGLNTSQSALYRYGINNSHMLKITLVWTDYPSSTIADINLVNDLNLKVTSPNGTKYYGNDFADPYNDSFDALNNVEQVIINSPINGSYEINISAYNIPNNPQPFALVISGDINNSRPVINSYFPNLTNMTIFEPGNQTFNVTYSDSDGDNLTVRWYMNSSLAKTGDSFNFTGNYSAQGHYNITAVVSDRYAQTENQWLLIVNNTNVLPIIQNLTINSSDGWNRTDSNLSVYFSYTDQDGDSITLNESRWFRNGSILFYNTTLINSANTTKNDVWIFSVRVYDGLNWSLWYNSSNLTIRNTAPVMDNISNITASELDQINITANASDIDNDQLTYSINNSFFSQNGNNFSWTTNQTSSGNYDLNISVSDSDDIDFKIVRLVVNDISDFDNDGIIDIEDNDDDNDGLNDTMDRLLGNTSNINSTIPVILRVNESLNISKIFNETLAVNISDIDNNSLLYFNWNFSNKTLMMNFTLNYIAKNSSIAIKDLNLEAGFTKTVYINKSNSTHNYVCILDQEISSVSSMTSDCSGTNEVKVACSGTSGQYICDDLSNYYKVSGLSKSAVKSFYYVPLTTSGGGGGGGGSSSTKIDEAKPICSDNIDNDNDGKIDLADPGCENAFDNSERDPCIENWICAEWSQCNENNKMTRACDDRNYCHTEKSKPKTAESCIYVLPAKGIEETKLGIEPKIGEDKIYKTELLSPERSYWEIIVSTGIVFIAMFLIVIYVFRKRNYKPEI